jgi:hypothetical protein
MENICKKCQHFQAKGIMIDKDTWGLCTEYNKCGKPGVFRWGEDNACISFKPKEESRQAIAK